MVAAAAAAAYAWGAGETLLEPFYGAAARSMSESWHDFIFGAFDPAGTVTVDKLPGALWLQALSLRVFGFHLWAVVLPQVLEGVLTILVLYRAVRRLVGPVAGIAAAIALAASPVTVALNRGNVSDSLLILLTVLAADAASAALLTGRLRSLLLAGVWVGLAFQAKMLQAWLVLPALAVAYMVAAPGRPRVRLGQLALAGAVTVAVSLSWMTAVSLVPANMRPYVDGTDNDSLFSQVFDYNGIARLGHGAVFSSGGTSATFIVALAKGGEIASSQTEGIEPSWHRLLGGPLGRDDGWLLPAALIAAAAILLARRGADRRDPLRAFVLLWGTWLLVLAVIFSKGNYLNSYYLAALSPAIAALCGAGVQLFWQERTRPAARAGMAAALLASAGYGVYLLRGGVAVPGWLVPIALCLGVGGAAATLLARRVRGHRHPAVLVTGLVVACALPLPVVTSVVMVRQGAEPFTIPYQPAPAVATARASRERQALRDQLLVDRILSTYDTPIVFATDSSLLAAPYIFYTGEEILPIGGYWGEISDPSLSRIQRYIASGELRVFLLPTEPPSNDPRITWLLRHCSRVARAARYKYVQLAVYDCGSG